MAFDPPIGFSAHYNFPKYALGSNPGADALNENLVEAIDTKIYEAHQYALTALTFNAPLKLLMGVVSLDYEDNLKLSIANKLDTAQDIKTTSTTFQIARAGFGGAPDLTYKVKNYGDEWIVGNQKIDGYSAIGGAVDTNFKQKIYGHQKVTGNLTVDGDIYVGGVINQVNVVDLNVADHAIRLNKGGDDTTALDGGIEILGASDALLGSIKYQGTRWLSDLDFDIASGKVYKINNVEVLNATTLGANVVSSSLTSIGTLNHDLNIANTKVYKINNAQVLSSTALGTTVVSSSLTSVGTLTTGVWHASVIDGTYLNYNTTNLKVTANQLNTIQDIATTSSPQFANITLTGTLDQQGTGTSYFGSQNILPKQKYYSNLGSLQYKWLTLHAAELWVETLVAQNTIATIGGRVLVGPTTTLIQDLAAAATTIYVKHNQMTVGDRVYMEADGKVEFMAIAAGPYGTAGNYYYSVTRNLDGSGANDWYSGDAVFNTGQTGNGFIDLYSIRGVKSSSQSGPTIVGNVRNSATYNDWSEHWAIGNLNNLYGYTTNVYGVGLGKYAANNTNITIDATNGYRIRNYTTTIASWDNTGKMILGQVAANNSRLEMSNGAINFIYRDGQDNDTTKINLDASGTGMIAGWTLNNTDIRKTIGTAPNTKFVALAAQSSGLSGTGGNYPVLAMADNQNPMYISIGHAYYKSSFQNEFGITFANDPFNTSADPIFQVTKNMTTGALTTKLAGWNFNATTLYGVNTSKYTGMQVPAALTTKCFFAGATDNVGASARFYVQADGKIVTSDASGNVLFDSDTIYADLKNIGRVFYSDTTQCSLTNIAYATVKQGTIFLLPNETTVQLVFRAWINGSTTATGKIRLKLEQVLQLPSTNAEIGNYETAVYSNEVTFGNGETSCFDYYHTIIKTPDGEKFLYELQPGDKVISFNEEKRILETSEIEEVLVAETDEYYLLDGITRVTGEHPLFVNLSGGGWMKIKDVPAGVEVLKNHNGLHFEKVAIRKEEGKLKTATLRMKSGDNPSFIADNFIAHNKGPAQAFALFGICKKTTGLTAESLYRWTIEAYTSNASYAAKIDNIALTAGRNAFSQTSQTTGF